MQKINEKHVHLNAPNLEKICNRYWKKNATDVHSIMQKRRVNQSNLLIKNKYCRVESYTVIN